MLENCELSGFADEIDPSISEQLALLGKLGVRFIEFRSGDGKKAAEYTADEVLGLKKRLDEAGIAVSAIGSAIGKIEITDDFKPHFETFKHVVGLAKLLDTRCIRMFSFYIPPGQKASIYRGEVMRRLRAMIDYARENGVVLLHENEKGIYGDSAERCLDLFETLGCEHFQCTFDFANFVQVGQDTLEAYEMLKPYIAYIHVKDALQTDGRVVPAGEGDGHVEEILRKLNARNFRGFLSLEPHLAIFSAYKGIERGGKEPELTDGAYAWKTAYEAAVKLLGWQAKV